MGPLHIFKKQELFCVFSGKCKDVLGKMLLDWLICLDLSDSLSAIYLLWQPSKQRFLREVCLPMEGL
jgi:hypothetical protein